MRQAGLLRRAVADIARAEGFTVNEVRAHLLGRIGWIAAINPQPAIRWRRQFADIIWDS